jgi:agmatine deiminase
MSGPAEGRVAVRTPREDGFAMPPEWAPHERTIMGWPTRRELWEDVLGQAKADYAATANAIAAFEPVTMVVNARDAAEARAALSRAVELVELPIDDSWLRDNGPIFLLGADGARAASTFAFNAWGEKFTPFDEDARLARRLCERWDIPTYEPGMVLEGGSVHVDGRGTVVTTEQCLLHPSRNPSMDREQIERRVLDFLGGDRMVWLGQGLVEDRDTDGHVDLVCAPCPGGELLFQGVEDGDPNAAEVASNVAIARDAGFATVELARLPRTSYAGEDVAVSYLNFYVCNDGVVVPVSGDEYDPEALRVIGGLFPGREVVGVPGVVLAFGGGGPHCITQQVPAIT